MRGNLSESKINMVEESMTNIELAENQSTPSRSERVRQERIAQNRERKSLGLRSPLAFAQRPGYVRRMINDVNNRISDAMEAGYTPVLDESKTQTDGDIGRATQMANAVKRQVGNGVTAYLMEIPKEWYDEDQKKKQKRPPVNLLLYVFPRLIMLPYHDQARTYQRNLQKDGIGREIKKDLQSVMERKKNKRYQKDQNPFSHSCGMHGGDPFPVVIL